MLKPNGYDSYFEPKSEDAHDFVEQKAHELLANAFNPNNYQNMTQALIEGYTPDKVAFIEEMLDTHDFEKLGRAIWNQSHTYWEQKALDEANLEWSKQ